MPGRDDRAEGVAEEREAVELERLRQPVDVPREDLEGERRRIDTLALPLSALVDVEDAELLAERVEPGPQVRVVEPRPAVEDDQRQPRLADGLDEHRVAVGELDVHESALNVQPVSQESVPWSASSANRSRIGAGATSGSRSIEYKTSSAFS